MTGVIAEFCQNHNGDFGLITEMVHAAKESGAEYAKIQTIFADELAFRPQFEQGLTQNEVVRSIKRPFGQEYERLKGLEITYDQMADFVALCNKAGIKPLTTCFTRKSIPRIAEAGFEEIKVASYDCASYQLIRELKENFSKIFVSTGATYDSEIQKTASILDGHDHAFFHCVTIYPTPLSMANINRMNFLNKFSSSVGFSDHSSVLTKEHLVASKVAILSGAALLERHFTLLRPETTKDGPVSISPKDIEDLISFAGMSRHDQKEHLNGYFPDWEISLGSDTRQLSVDEILNRDYYRGRFCSKVKDSSGNERQIFNWEEIELCR